MKSFKEELAEIFDRFMRKMEEVLDLKKQSNEKVVDKTFIEINRQRKQEASQDEELEIKSQSNFQSLQEKHGKEHESDGIDVSDIKLNNTTSSRSPSSFHVNKDENVLISVTLKALAQCSQPLLPDKSNDLIYGVESMELFNTYLNMMKEFMMVLQTLVQIFMQTWYSFQSLVTFQIMLDIVDPLLSNQMT